MDGLGQRLPHPPRTSGPRFHRGCRQGRCGRYRRPRRPGSPDPSEVQPDLAGPPPRCGGRSGSLSEAPPLSIDGLSAGYGRKPVISDVAFTVEAGEIFGLIGLNGVGKTTLIKAILGLARADGTISLFGRPAGPPEGR
ncbi:MAG TPA: ATP-binding cassette domain-containing protein, partial [Rhodospirillaceae bacterium]|nr:ATP-binding cassette domain-containing protein [Rhodospirillaceae bacterium]